MLFKTAPVQIKAGPADGLAEGEFTAYASVFDNKDAYGDIVRKGAFARTLAEWAKSSAQLPLLFGHRMDDPDYNIGHIAAAMEDDHGLLVTARLDLDQPKAQSTYRLIKGRRINQMSFAYDVVEGAFVESEGDEFYELRDLDLWEVSVVPIGANDQTEILAVKAAAASLESGVKAGRTLSAKNESELRIAHDAIGRVLAGLAPVDEEKTSGHTETNDEEPASAKSEESRVNPSVIDLLDAFAFDLEMEMTP